MPIRDSDITALVLARLESLDRNIEMLKADVRINIEAIDHRVTTLDHRLWGNGQKGTIADIREEIESTRRAHRNLDKKIIKIGALISGAMLVLGFMTGNGWASFSNVLKVLGH